jgi:uncharacterized protein YaiL (DUF2058 family)
MSLKDQLVKAGLVSEQQARQSAHTERKKRKEPGGAEDRVAAEARRQVVEREREAQRARDRELARGRQKELARRQEEAAARDSRHAQIEAAIRLGRIESWAGTRTYYFQVGSHLESLSVNDDAAKRLQEGRAAIVRTGDLRQPYMLLHSAQAMVVRQIESGRVVVLHEG